MVGARVSAGRMSLVGGMTLVDMETATLSKQTQRACDLCTVPFRKTDPRARDIPYIYICISLHTLAPTLTYVDGDLQVGLVD